MDGMKVGIETRDSLGKRFMRKKYEAAEQRAEITKKPKDTACSCRPGLKHTLHHHLF